LEIERKISEGVSYREIARQFCVCKSAVGNHIKNHIPKAIEQVQKDREIKSGLNILEEFRRILEELNRLRNEAQEITHEAWNIFHNVKIAKAVNSDTIKFLADVLEKLSQADNKLLKLIEIQAKFIGILRKEKEAETPS
jgi:predicted transcriptional regulator